MKRKYQRTIHNYPTIHVETPVGTAKVDGYDFNRVDWEIWNPVYEGLTTTRICGWVHRKDGQWLLPYEQNNGEPYRVSHALAEAAIVRTLETDFLLESQSALNERQIKKATDGVRRCLGLKMEYERHVKWCEESIEKYRQSLRDYGQNPYLPEEMQQELAVGELVKNKKKTRTQSKRTPLQAAKADKSSLLLRV